MFVEPSRSTCTWVEKCDMSTLPNEILWPQKDSTWISISNRSAWNKGGVPAGSRPAQDVPESARGAGGRPGLRRDRGARRPRPKPAPDDVRKGEAAGARQGGGQSHP